MKQLAADVPDRIGPYKILDLLGVGGMGIVYLAEQSKPIHRRVALKIIKLGMDTKSVIARFETEREALALMNHPNVAKVFDAGATEQGRPYFVMEYVPGIPITDYCDKHRLNTEERLRLFMDVCNAVQHAHQKGIIHRDIKPSNVLVSVDPSAPSEPRGFSPRGVGGTEMPGVQVKVIDFGVAKATQRRLTELTLFTEQGQLIGTPGYMSPEQAEMTALDIDTRTDIYSLGVLLYELLVGSLPFDTAYLLQKGLAEIQRIIREVDPPKPSTRLSALQSERSTKSEPKAPAPGQSEPRAPATGLPVIDEAIRLRRTEAPRRSDEGKKPTSLLDAIAHRRHTEPKTLFRQIRGDLDWIVMKALEKDRTRRYDTANAFAADVARYLSAEPVLAAPPSATYRVRKFIRRYRGPVVAAGLVMAALVLGVIGTTIGLGEARRQQQAAESAQRSEALAKEEALTKRNEAEAARKDAEFEAYVANLIAAEASLAADEPAQVRARLDACPERLRGWEWHWLNARSDESVTVLRGHEHRVNFAAYDPDGVRIVTASSDKTARVWDAATGNELIVLRGHEDGVRYASFSPDGTRIVTASLDKTARVWDATTGKEQIVLRGHEDSIRTVAYSPDGARIATASQDTTARVWDAATGRELIVLWGHSATVYSAAYSPDGTRIVTASGGSEWTARVWDAATGEELVATRRHEEPVLSAAFSPDGTRILTASVDGTARVWDAASGKELTVLFRHQGVGFRRGVGGIRSAAAAYSPDGSRILTNFLDRTVQVWDAVTGKQIAVLNGHESGVSSAAYSPDGTRVVTASWDHTARVWDAAFGNEVTVLRGRETYRGPVAAAISPNGTRIVTTSGDRTARVWDAATGKELFVLGGGGGSIINCVAYDRDGTRIVTASGDRTARVWDAATGEELSFLHGHDGSVASAAYSADGTRIVTASRDKTARVWDAVTGHEMVVLRGHESDVRSAAYSPDGTRIVTASYDGTAQLWEAATGTGLTVLGGHEGQVDCASYSPDGTRIVTASWDKTARVWNASTGRQIFVLRGHDGEVHSAAYSPDGTRIVTASTDNTARIWDAATGKELGVLRGHDGWVSSAAFSLDGTRIVTASGDGTARVWNSVPYRERFPAIARARAAQANMEAQRHRGTEGE